MVPNFHFLTAGPRKYGYLPSGSLTQPWKDPPFLKGKPSINGPFSMAMLNNQRVNNMDINDDDNPWVTLFSNEQM